MARPRWSGQLAAPKIRGHELLYRKALARRLNADGPIEPATIELIARRLASALPPA